MIRYTVVLLLLIPFQIYAQKFFWVERFGGLSRDQISSTVIDSSGYNYHVGYFSQSLYFDDSQTVLTAEANDDIYMTKYDMAGNFVWAKQIAGSSDEYASQLRMLNDGTLLLYGRFKGVLDVNMGTDEHNLTSNGSGFNTFLANYDTDGNFIWAKQFSGDGNNTPYDMKLDNEGSIFLSGRFTGMVDFDPDPVESDMITSAGGFDSYLIKLNSEGIYAWGKHFTGASSVLTQEFFIYNSDLYYVGNFQGSMRISPENSPVKHSLGVNDLFIARIRIDGTLDTLISYGTVRNDEFSTVIVNELGIFLSGTFIDEIDIDPHPSSEYILTSNGGVDAFALALDFDLRFVWANHFGGSEWDLAGNAHMALDGTLLFDLRYNATVSLEVNGTTLELSTAGLTDVAFLTLDPTDGSVMSVYEIKGTGSEYAFLTEFHNGEHMISGGFEGSTDFDDTESSNNIIFSHGITDCFISHVDLRMTSASYDVFRPQSIHLFPVPVSAGSTLHVDIEEFTGQVIIIDAYGRSAHREYITSPQLHLPGHLSPGMYYVLLFNVNGMRAAGNFIIL